MHHKQDFVRKSTKFRTICFRWLFRFGKRTEPKDFSHFSEMKRNSQHWFTDHALSPIGQSTMGWARWAGCTMS